jgi:hypothetical protein
MGVHYEYYRAKGREAAVAEPEAPRVVGEPGLNVFDAVETKWWDPQGVLGQLIALIRGVPFTQDLVDSVDLYPPPEGAPQSDEELEALPEDSPYLYGPNIEELPVTVRDTLAHADDTRLPEIAGQLAKIDTFIGAPHTEEVLMLIKELVGLARRAKENDQMLYCWSGGF